MELWHYYDVTKARSILTYRLLSPTPTSLVLIGHIARATYLVGLFEDRLFTATIVDYDLLFVIFQGMKRFAHNVNA